MGLLGEWGGCEDTSCHGSYWLAWAPSSGHHDSVGAARDMLITPLDHQRVLPFVLEQVGDIVQSAAHMLHQDLFAGCPWAMYPHQQHVVA